MMQRQSLRFVAIALLTSNALTLRPQDPAAINQHSTDNGGLITEGVETFDGVPLNAIPEGRPAVPHNAIIVPTSAMAGWTAIADRSVSRGRAMRHC